MGIREYLGVFRRRGWLVAVVVVVITAAAVGLARLQTPRYQATAEILIQPSSTNTLFSNGSGAQPVNSTAISTGIELLRSQPVQNAVIAKVGAAPPVVAAEVGQTDVITVSARSTDPKVAAQVANAYANAYIDFRRTEDVNSQLAAAAQIQTRVADLQNQINVLNARISAGGAPAQPTLGPQVDNLIQAQGAFKQQLGQLQVKASLNNGGAELVTNATPPASPITPQPKRAGLLGIFVGLVLGVALAFLLDYMDDSIKSKADLDRVAHGLPNLALIPKVSAFGSRDAVVISTADPRSPGAEAYRSLRTAIQFASLDHTVHTVMVTSPSAAEGKTTTLANLGVALAQAGLCVVLTCCDLRRPRLHEFFGLDNAIGFTSVLLGEIPLSQALQDVPGVKNLRLLASGPIPPNPAELLSSLRTAEVLTALQGQADVVLIDTPPVLPVTDAAVLSGRVDGVLMVATVGSTTGKLFTRALEVLGQVDAPLIGTVLNGVTGDGSYGYSYQYYRYDPDGGRSGRRFRRETSADAPAPDGERVTASFAVDPGLS